MYSGDNIKINGKNVHYDTLVRYVKHIHSHQGIDRDDVGSIMGWDMLRANLHEYVFKTVDDVTEEWSKQLDEFVENLFICKICGEVPPYFDWYCRKCDEFVSLGEVMARLEKYKIENYVLV